MRLPLKKCSCFCLDPLSDPGLQGACNCPASLRRAPPLLKAMVCSHALPARAPFGESRLNNHFTLFDMRNQILILLALIAISCQTQPKMEAQQRALIEAYITAYNAFDVPGMTQNLHPDILFENSSGGQVDLSLTGVDAFQKQATEAAGYFTSRKQTVTNWQFKGDTVTINIDYEAVLAVDLPNGMKAGDLLRLQGESEFVFAEEQIISITDRS